MRISPKQNQVVEAIASRKYDEIFLIGALGTTKTFGMAFIFMSLARNYPGSFIPIARKTLAEIKKGTLHSFLEAAERMNLVEGKDYRLIGGMSGNEIMIVFSNKSIITFVPLDKSKDREWQGVKSINATAVGIDEVDGVEYLGYVSLSARAGRKNANGAPAFTLSTCNPNEKWVKEQIYKPFRKNKLPPNVLVIQFEMQDSPLYYEGFYDKYENNPPQWKERYLYNNWDYIDDDNSLFKNRILDEAETPKYDKNAEKFLGVDAAREGKDRNVLATIAGDTLYDIDIYDKSDLDRMAKPDEKKAPPYSHIMGRQIMQHSDREGIGWYNTAVDAVGNGSGIVDALRLEHRNVNEFKAGARSELDYDMLRSEVYHKLAIAMEKGEFKIWDGCPFINELRQELLWHLYEVKDKVMCVERKSEIKKRLGMSPDIADAVAIAWWVKTSRAVGSYSGVDVSNKVEDDDVKPITSGLIDKRF